MKVIGIIAEYNPFHNGHLYQIEKIKQETNADYLVVVLSGDFVQRGTPALLDKYTRTRMALACGVDLVLELPALWATASAEYFSSAGIACLDKLGVVDGVCFGAECPDTHLLSYLADILLNEPLPYRLELNRLLKEGKPFPSARMGALSAYLFQCGSTLYQPEDILTTLISPNNILAIEYIKELKRRQSTIKPYPIRRVGGGYHEKELSKLASATAIRQLLQQYINCMTASGSIPDDTGQKLLSAMPEAVTAILLEYMKDFPLINEDALSSILKYKLLSMAPNGYDSYADCTTALSNRLAGNLDSFRSFSGFCEQLKSREVTHSRLSRVLTHILLNITQNDYLSGREMDYIPYLRVLGFRKSATQLLGNIKAHSSLPLLTKMADANRILQDIYPPDSFAHQMLALDVFAADVYTSVLTDISGKSTKNEYTHGIVIV